MPAIITTLGRLAIGTAGSAPNRRIDFSSFQIGVRDSYTDANRNRGKFDRNMNRVRLVRKQVEPSLSMTPTAFELGLILQWICGASPTTTGQVVTYPFGNTAHEVSLAYHDGQASPAIHTYHYNAVRTANFSSSDGDPTLNVNMNLIGRHYDTAIAWPSLTPPYDEVDIVTQPFVHTDTSNAVVINSVTVPTRSIGLSINHTIPERYLNSLLQTANFRVDRQYQLNLDFPLGEAPALYDVGGDGVTAVITYTNGGTSLKLTMPKVQFPREPIAVELRNEIYHRLPGTCYESVDGATPALKIELDQTI